MDPTPIQANPHEETCYRNPDNDTGERLQFDGTAIHLNSHTSNYPTLLAETPDEIDALIAILKRWQSIMQGKVATVMLADITTSIQTPSQAQQAFRRVLDTLNIDPATIDLTKKVPKAKKIGPKGSKRKIAKAPAKAPVV